MERRIFDDPDAEPGPGDAMAEIMEKLREQREAAQLHRRLTNDFSGP